MYVVEIPSWMISFVVFFLLTQAGNCVNCSRLQQNFGLTIFKLFKFL